MPQLMYATGHFRNGVLLSALTAQLVADALLNQVRDPMLQFTDPSRFGNV
jgi:glycine oxidase